jgi:ABC-2 type transport system ATP-binding protein
VITARGLTRAFGELVAVDHIDLEIARGEVFGLVGPDGAGKTTTLRMLCGLMDPTAGEATVAGHDVVREPQAVKDRIGYMAQRFGLYADLSVLENMRFYADLFGLPESERVRLFPELLSMTRMEPFADRFAGKLSGGMKQKLALMCTLLHQPEILFLDEPTNGVDPVSRRDFWLILRRLVDDGLTVFVTTAYLDEAERCGRVALMDRGSIIRCDTPERLKAEVPVITWEVQASELRQLRELREQLRAAPGVIGAEPVGARLHVYTASPDAPHASNARIRRIEPSLEDVFIAHIRSRERAG